MSDGNPKGAQTSGVHSVEGVAGGASRNLGLRVQDAGEQLTGKIQAAADKVEDVISEAADEATMTISKFTDQAKDVYDRTSLAARKVAETVDPFVLRRPYAALGIVAALGVVIGLLMSRRSPEVIYVKRDQ
jgi:ElaB/YqjD/DUF883 family membrane-anchored ribosome-binding protein